MLMELAYRLAIEESPFIQTIRNNAIFVFTPASEVDGREKQVDNFRAQQKGQPSPSMVYWGKYVQHDNNRDGIGVGLRLTQVMLKTFLEWHPTSGTTSTSRLRCSTRPPAPDRTTPSSIRFRGSNGMSCVRS